MIYGRSDVQSVHSPDCPTGHVRKKGDTGPFVLDCGICEPIVKQQAGLWSDSPGMVPLTPDEEAYREQEDRDIALAMAAEGQAIRTAATERVRKTRATKAQAAQKPARRRVVR